MERFKDLPLGSKITWSILWTSVIALVISAVATITFELSSFKKAAMDDLMATAEIVSANCSGAVAFDDKTAADQILSNLKARKNIVAARIFKDGQPFATYLREDASPQELPMAPLAESKIIEEGKLHVFQNIRFRADNIGVMYVQSDMKRVYYRLQRYVGIIVMVLAALIPVVFFISKKLQRIIAKPIQDLADVATQVTANNFSVRAEAQGRDEVGRLTRTFNQMLDTIQITNTRLIESNQKLVEQAEALWRSNKELEQFAYVSSHDLQEPLRKIITYSQLLETEVKDKSTADGERYFSNIVNSAARMQTLIKDLLAYSRLNRPETKSSAIDLNLVIQEVLNDLENIIKESSAKILTPSLPTVRGNSFQLHQLFQNLIGNGIKFKGQDPPTVRITCEQESGHWLFGVHDNGIGIEPKYQEQIFKVFQRLHDKDSYPGTGIGLAICKKVVEQAGGKIWIHSEVGKGSTFYFTWPQ